MPKKPFALVMLQNWLLAVIIVLTLLLAVGLLNAEPRSAQAVPPSQGPIVVDAVDNDPDNKLWNCETNRVTFGNEEVDRSRCFSFHYSVPPGGINSATVHISISTLGAQQDTDATVVAVGKPYEPCAWGQGKMPGCVTLHGGFKGGEKSLNLNLLDIACDPTMQGSPEAQALVRAQLQTGTLHMLLQDDTAVYRAQLVLNGGTPSFPCGTSTNEITVYVPTTHAPTAQPSLAGTPALSALERGVNTLLTGTSSPNPPDIPGAAAAAAAGAVSLGLLALLNNLLAGSTAGGTSVLGQTAASYTAGGAAVPGQAPAGYTAGSASVEGRVEISDALALDRSLGEQARSQLTQALPDVKDELADTFIGLAAEKEKRRSIEEEKRRLQTLVAEKKRLYEEAGEALKRAIDGAGDFDGAQREWRKAADDFQKAENDLKQFLEQYPGQAQDKAQQGKS